MTHKVEGAMHPLVAIKRAQAKVLKRGVGIVYSATGVPKISPDWVEHLNDEERAWAESDLASRGYRLNSSNVPERI